MNNTQKHAKRELDILSATVNNAIIIPFSKEILDLCEKFGNSGQSGGSAPFTASAISKAIEKLLLQEPICDLSGHEDEWVDVTKYGYDYTMYQNIRCGSLFKKADNKAYYLNAIVWKLKNNNTFTGNVYMDNENYELVGSSQYVKFPFKPKTFYIDVISLPITKEEAENKNIHYIEDRLGNCHYNVIKNKKQLNKVFKYYTKK